MMGQHDCPAPRGRFHQILQLKGHANHMKRLYRVTNESQLHRILGPAKYIGGHWIRQNELYRTFLAIQF